MAEEDLTSELISGRPATKPEAAMDISGAISGRGPRQIRSAEEAEKLAPGTEFIDPGGKKRVVPYRPKSPEELDKVPEGSQFVDPEGRLRQVPTYQGIDFTAQTLYDMAANDREREKALSRSYPGKVKRQERTGEFYVDDDGVLRKPKGFTGAPGAYAAAQAAPVVGSIAGEVAGGVLGSAVGPAGTVGGAVVGGAGGAAAGQAFNDAMLSLAGVYDRSAGEEAKELATAGVLGGAGSLVGQGLSAASPVIKSQIKTGASKIANKIAGTDPEALRTGIELREQGVMVPVSPMFTELPHVGNVVEVFHPAFHTNKPLRQSAIDYYEKTGTQLLEDVGVAKPGKITDPKAAVSSQAAGEAVLKRASAELDAANADINAIFTAQKSMAEAKTIPQAANIKNLHEAHARAQQAAEKVIQLGFEQITADADAAMKVAKAGYNSGDLWFAVGEKLRSVKAAISQQASKRYNQADALAGDFRPNVEQLTDVAQNVLEQMPEGFANKYPGVVKQIRDMAGVPKLDEHGQPTAEWLKEPVSPTWGQLHALRTAVRSNVNYYDLTPDFREGALKLMAKRVNEALHEPNVPSNVREAQKFLDATDAWYSKVIKPLTDHNIQTVIKGLESGLPADPKKLYDVLIKEGRSDLTNKIRKLVGPSLWGAIKAADIMEMLANSRTLIPGETDGRAFAKQVLDRYRSGMLEAVHGKEAARLMEQAQRIAQLDGRLPLPTSIRPGDQVTSIIARAREAADAVKQAAKQDPLSMLSKETKYLDRERQREMMRMRKEFENSPLDFLYKGARDKTLGAAEAADRILAHEDTILAAAAKFGDQSPEFNMLRRVWAERILTGTLKPSEELEKVTEEVQRLMFPGASLDQMKMLAKNMDFLMSGKAASRDMGAGLSMAATAKVEHPLSSLPKVASVPLKVATLGLADPIARMMLSKYYDMVFKLTNSPAFLRWMEKGLKGDDISREMVRKEVQARMRIGGPIGAGVATEAGQQPGHPARTRVQVQPRPGYFDQAQRYGEKDLQNARDIGQVGEHADWAKFEAEARPSQNVESMPLQMEQAQEIEDQFFPRRE